MSEIRQVMSRAEAFKAAHWVEANWEQLKEMTRAEAAGALSKGIGKPISQHAMMGLLRDIGKEFPGKVRRVTGTSLASDRPRFLAVQIQKMDNALMHVFAELGIKRDQETLLDHANLARVRGGLSILTENGEAD